MKNYKWKFVALIILVVVPRYAHANPALQVVNGVLAKLSPGQWIAKYHFTNFRIDKTTQTYTLRVKSRSGNHVHVLFVEPARDAGREILNKDGEIWSFLPDSRKVIRLTDRDSIGNGDFNNADVLRLNWLDQYNMALVKETKNQYIVEMTAKEGISVPYYLIRLWVLKEGNQPVQQYFYDNSGHHLKTLKYRNIKNFGNISRPASLVMENVITGQKTSLEVIEFQSVDNLPENLFRPDALGK